MDSITDIETKLKQLKPKLNRVFYVDRIGYFGSYSRNEHHENSDIDILVSFSKPIGWEFFDLKEYLESQLDKKVDLVSENAIKEQLRDIILSSVKYI